MSLLLILEMVGTVAFAVSGAGTAMKKDMDVFGVMILGMTTAVGGGILRDLILGVTPPMAFTQPIYALTALAVSLLVFLPGVRKLAQHPNAVPMLLMDSVGLAVFTVVGVRAGMGSGNLFLAAFVGVLTGVGGGVLRDLFAGDRPGIFVRHFYATASLIGAGVTLLAWGQGENAAMIIGAVVIFVLRLLAARFRWSLPRAE